MQTQEVLAEEWSSFFDRFSRMYKDKRVTVETMGKDVGVQANARDMPLMGITAEPRDGARGDRKIEIMVGDSPHAHVIHVITRPYRVRVAEWNDGYSAALQIETEDDWTTLLRAGPQDQVLPEGLITDDIILPDSPPRR
jgi:hypothetical protein